MIDADAPFRWLWDRIVPGEQNVVLDFFRRVLRENGDFVCESFDSLEKTAQEECNMVSRDSVKQIASEEYGMVEGKDEER